MNRNIHQRSRFIASNLYSLTHHHSPGPAPISPRCYYVGAYQVLLIILPWAWQRARQASGPAFEPVPITGMTA